MSTLEGNRLIADFMGYKKDRWPFESDDRYKVGSLMYPICNLKFHDSWDWLMPACKKFDGLNLMDTEYEKLCDEIDNAVSCYERPAAWNNLITAIIWHKNKFHGVQTISV